MDYSEVSIHKLFSLRSLILAQSHLILNLF